MELSPQSVASTTFRIVKKGYDPDEVRGYLSQLASSIEQTQSQATAMEARARAAVARLQELAAQPPAAAPPSAAEAVVPAGDAEVISRTLMLAQRTADATVHEAQQAAKGIRERTEAEAEQVLSTAREQAARMVDEAKAEARRAHEAERVQAESEVKALLTRRASLLSDVDQLEHFIVTQRERLRDVASEIGSMAERVPVGLADLRPPAMSGAAAPAALAPVAAPDRGEVTDAAPEALDEPGDDDDPDATVAMTRVPWIEPEAEGGAEIAAEAGGDDTPEGDDEPVAGATAWAGPAASDRASGPAPAPDSTPADGANAFLFEDITGEIPSVGPLAAAADAERGQRTKADER
jgi:DivIVA domain-containing protein